MLTFCEVTWDADYFSPEDPQLQLNAEYAPSLIGTFELATVDASQGYYAWTVYPEYLLGSDDKVLMLTMTYLDSDGINITLKGPEIIVVDADISITQPQESSGSHTNPAAIAVPVIVGFALIAMGLFFLWRKNKQRIIIAGIRRRSSQGYGVGKSHMERTRMGSTKGATVAAPSQSPVSPPPPAHGRNVFREEVRRQEKERELA